MSDKGSGDKQPWIVPIAVAIVGAISAIAVAWINKPPQPTLSPSTSSTTLSTLVPSPKPSSIPSTSQPSSSIQPVNYKLLKNFLSNREFIKADEETSRILLQITGNELNSHNDPVSASKIACSVYSTIDQLWSEYSKAPSGESKFGFSVQRRIWITEGSHDKFGERVGWRRNNDWLTYDALDNDTARNLGEVPAGYLPSKFRGPIARPKLSGGWMLWSLLPGNSAGRCLP
ncbi:MAG: GUN4 domain-containing protein [Microcystis panniformis WG22]|nr:GUN4 domain-containing protein [Microcystis panniformis WG22]